MTIYDILPRMSAWIEHQFPTPSYSTATIPPCTIDYTPIALSLPVTETTHDGKRWYLYEGQLYPSISNLISATDTEGKKSLQEWRKRVGHTTATSITQKAAARGTRWHKFCENYVTRQPIGWQLFEDPEDAAYGAHIATVLNQQLRTVVASETRVVSKQYGIAGRMDLGVQLQDGRYAILDFKTGKNEISGEDAKTNLQLACYQLGVILDGFEKKLSSTQVSGAQLVYLASKNKSYSTRDQDALHDVEGTKEILSEIANGMGAATFTARKNDMCKQCKVKPSCPLYLEGKAVHQ